MANLYGNQLNLQLNPNDSDDDILDTHIVQSEATSLKLSQFADDDLYTEQVTSRDVPDELPYKPVSSKKRKEKRRRHKDGDKRRSSNRKMVNTPASQPYIRVIDGEERLCFKYNTKISEAALNAMPRADLDDNEFCVRFDLDSVDTSKLNDKFKSDNAIYPSANLPYATYSGNRWDYENECNRLAWAFVSLNPVVLYGKKGLLQRAVDSYRNIRKQNRNKKIYMDDKFLNAFEKRKHRVVPPSHTTFSWVSRGIRKTCKVLLDIEELDYSKIDAEFKHKYSVFMDDFDEHSFGLCEYESQNKDNELAVKIAFANVENASFWTAVRALDKMTVLRRSIEAYNTKKDEILMDDVDDISRALDGLTNEQEDVLCADNVVE